MKQTVDISLGDKIYRISALAFVYFVLISLKILIGLLD